MAKPVLLPQSLIVFQEGEKILFPGIYMKEEGPAENQDAASGPVSLAGPPRWPESKNIQLWVFY